MPKFRFAVKDEWGMRKTGVMEASSLDAARTRLVQGGFEVESLVDDGKSLPLDVADRLPAASGKRLLYVSQFCVLVACLVFLSQWLLRAKPADPPKEVRLRLVGRLDSRSSDPSQARLLIDLPEVPLRLEYPWREIVTSERAFAAEVSFLAEQVPSYAWVRFAGSKVPGALRLDAEAPDRPELRKIELKGHQIEVGDVLWKLVDSPVDINHNSGGRGSERSHVHDVGH